MNLTHIDRLKYLLGIELTQAGRDNEIKQYISAVSRTIEKWLDRELQSQSYTEYFNVQPNQKNFKFKAYPISAITSVYEDSEGLYDGNESEIKSSNYSIINDSSMIYLHNEIFPAPKGLRVIATGGLAANATQLEGAISSVSGTITAGSIVTGQSSGAVAKLIDGLGTGSTVFKMQVLAGIFQTGETIGDGSHTGVLGAFSAVPLAQTYPYICHACELQCVHIFQRIKKGLGSTGSSSAGGNTSFESAYNLLDVVENILNPYRNIWAS